MELTKEEFLSYVDHSLLKPNLTLDEVVRGLEFAAEVKAKAVCITPHRLGIAMDVLECTGDIIGMVTALILGVNVME